MSLELIRELTAALEYEHSFLTGRESHYGESVELLIRARAYLKSEGWTRVEDGLPVVPDGEKSVPIYVVSNGLVLRTDTTTLGLLVGVTHWRYAEPMPEPPKGNN